MDIALGLSGNPGAVARAATAAEAADVESVWVAELDRSYTVSAAAAIAATTRVRVGTALALAFARSPTFAAMEVRDLGDLSGGRFLLGLGTQVKKVMEARFSVPYERPVARLVEYAAVLRTVWAAGRSVPANTGPPTFA